VKAGEEAPCPVIVEPEKSMRRSDRTVMFTFPNRNIGCSRTSAIIINTYLGAVAARGSTASYISVAPYQQAAVQRKRCGLTGGLSLLKKIAP
jgi:hypothetical protein